MFISRKVFKDFFHQGENVPFLLICFFCVVSYSARMRTRRRYLIASKRTKINQIWNAGKRLYCMTTEIAYQLSACSLLVFPTQLMSVIYFGLRSGSSKSNDDDDDDDISFLQRAHFQKGYISLPPLYKREQRKYVKSNLPLY